MGTFFCLLLACLLAGALGDYRARQQMRRKANAGQLGSFMGLSSMAEFEAGIRRSVGIHGLHTDAESAPRIKRARYGR